ncbi:MAG: hypothetical protein GX892_12980 [Thermoanaerobacteraceae bacterium]|nr:hypothetical protein [Thermoanaerobacteraceae bacterium]
MSTNEKGGFRPPKFERIIYKCPKCGTFNSVKDNTCKNCGASKPEKAGL